MALLEILAVVGAKGSPLTAAEIIEATGLPRSTVFRKLRELCTASFLYEEQTSKRYCLGPRVLELGETAREQLSSGTIVAGPLLGLVGDTGETATFSILDAPWRICVRVIEAPSDLRQVAHVGARYPLHLGAAGKVILAFLQPTMVLPILESHGLVGDDADSIVTELERIRSEGVAITTSERVIGACTIAAPVLVRGRVFGSVAVVGPTDRMQPNLDRHLPRVLEVASALSLALPGSPPA